MAVGVITDMKRFNEQYYGGFQDRVQTRLDIFNQASLGCFSLSAMFHKGGFKEEAFFSDDMTVQHRTEGSVAAVTPNSISSDSTNMVKIRKLIAMSQTEQSFADQGLSMEVAAFLIGQKQADKTLEKWRESSVSCLVGAYSLAGLDVGGADELTVDISGSFGSNDNGVLTQDTVIDGMALMGDSALSRLKLVIMHSHVYFQLLKETTANLATPSTADFAVQTGMPIVFNLPILVVDSSALVISGGGNQGQDAYRTFLLQEGAIRLEESETPRLYTETKTLTTNVARVWQTELAYSVGLRGMSFNTAVPNPEDTALVSSANWTKKYDSKRDLAGVQIISVRTANTA